ncbi:MAG TPA: AAA family ATPase, partial [Lentisphaeria bacterium]|nr:AAA family ATPase [Lentisphaeria bacterium]
MLQQLTIRDFVIVDALELDFAQGFGALTGETGAGKSILVDALALALGERADAGVVRSGCDKAEVTACFNIATVPEINTWLAANDLDAGDELLLRRVVDAGGRSRAYINGSPATVQQLREVAENLVDIHGQHAHQSLLRADAQRALLDGHAGLGELAGSVARAFADWRAAEKQLAEVAASGAALLREREQLDWQVQELDALAFSADEWVELEIEHKRLTHAASLIEGAQFALATLAEGDAACENQVDAVVARLDGLAEFDPALQDVAQLLQSVQAELGEAISSLRRYAGRVDLDPDRLAEVERRIDAVYNAARKYRCQPPELPMLLAGWRARLTELGEAADLEALTAKAQTARATYRELAKRLSAGREKAAGELAGAVTELMRQLALGSGSLQVGL